MQDSMRRRATAKFTEAVVTSTFFTDIQKDSKGEQMENLCSFRWDRVRD